ncbi:phosphomevalonate kinase [Gadus morhua]|uniref:Phosphomevalonate kinase n=1 Tax=Gadus morhua TaxID=8049 RepID=A0A8C4ZLR5_GADMO|nr:phosphomevalonate kinase [Gadus morhua]XP_056459047.1 phosphomevalonate kinase [Gadus chalcogrammus]
MASAEPKIILVFSGKRKSGKDYVTDFILKRLGSEICCILRLSGPLKKQYAQDHGLDYSELLAAGGYKETHRADMIAWGEQQRRQDPGFFCRLATEAAQQPVWIVSDARRRSDLRWFQTEYPSQTRCVRVQASEETRADRGWRFTAGIDDAESECGLDGEQFDWIITNEAEAPALEEQLENILQLASHAAGPHNS